MPGVEVKRFVANMCVCVCAAALVKVKVAHAYVCSGTQNINEKTQDKEKIFQIELITKSLFKKKNI